jgi:hypothetical protein
VVIFYFLKEWRKGEHLFFNILNEPLLKNAVYTEGSVFSKKLEKINTFRIRLEKNANKLYFRPLFKI